MIYLFYQNHGTKGEHMALCLCVSFLKIKGQPKIQDDMDQVHMCGSNKYGTFELNIVPGWQ